MADTRKYLKELEKLKKASIISYNNKNHTLLNFDIANDIVTIKLLFGFGVNIETVPIMFDIKDWDENISKLTPIYKGKPVIVEPPVSNTQSTENNIKELRNHLFSALRKLEGGTMDAHEGKAVASVAQTILNSARLELEYREKIGGQNKTIKMLES